MVRIRHLALLTIGALLLIFGGLIGAGAGLILISFVIPHKPAAMLFFWIGAIVIVVGIIILAAVGVYVGVSL